MEQSPSRGSPVTFDLSDLNCPNWLERFWTGGQDEDEDEDVRRLLGDEADGWGRFEDDVTNTPCPPAVLQENQPSPSAQLCQYGLCRSSELDGTRLSGLVSLTSSGPGGRRQMLQTWNQQTRTQRRADREDRRVQDRTGESCCTHTPAAPTPPRVERRWLLLAEGPGGDPRRRAPEDSSWRRCHLFVGKLSFPPAPLGSGCWPLHSFLFLFLSIAAAL